ncbi:MAG: CvpA family protein [Lachnospiraceae bacterium]|nr:CvpA family protein [Lachnospiraceae bacterium]
MNILSIIVLIVLIWKITEGYKRGMVKEIISFVSLLVLCVVIALIGHGLQSYMEKEFLGVIIAVFLLGLLGIAHHLLGLVFFPAKLLSKLPIIHWADKLLGIIAGALETVIILWTVFIFAMNSSLGMLGQQILVYTQENDILSWLYRYNLLAKLLEDVIIRFSFN